MDEISLMAEGVASSPFHLDSIFLYLVEEGPMADLQQLRGMGVVTIRLMEGL
jgi:hypothetical protein